MLTFLSCSRSSPLITLLAAVLHANGESLVDLGLLSAATSVGTFAGAAVRGQGDGAAGDPTLVYARLGIVGAVALAVFACFRSGRASMVPLARRRPAVRPRDRLEREPRRGDRRTPRIRGGCRRSRRWCSRSAPPSPRSGRGRCSTAYGVHGLLVAAAVLGAISLACAICFRAGSAAPRLSRAPF